MESRVPEPYEDVREARLQQGDIFRDVTLLEGIQEAGGGVEAVQRQFAYVVVITQDCDLEQDFRNRSNVSTPPKHDKYLQSVLLCPAYQSETFRAGKHLEGVQLIMESSWSSNDWKKILQNVNYRYHALEPYPTLQIPQLIIDFKHYLTAPRDTVYNPAFRSSYLGTIAELYRENLSTRFAYYLSRVALPEPTDS